MIHVYTMSVKSVHVTIVNNFNKLNY